MVWYIEVDVSDSSTLSLLLVGVKRFLMALHEAERRLLLARGGGHERWRRLLRPLPLLHDALHDKCARVASIATTLNLERHHNCRLHILRSIHQLLSLLLRLFLLIFFSFLGRLRLPLLRLFCFLLLSWVLVPPIHRRLVKYVIEALEGAKNVALDIFEIAVRKFVAAEGLAAAAIIIVTCVIANIIHVFALLLLLLLDLV